MTLIVITKKVDPSCFCISKKWHYWQRMKSVVMHTITLTVLCLSIQRTISITLLNDGTHITNATTPTHTLTQDELEYFNNRKKRKRRYGIDVDVSY